MNGGCYLKSELQLSTDMVGRQPVAQRVAYHPIPERERGGRGGGEKAVSLSAFHGRNIHNRVNINVID